MGLIDADGDSLKYEIQEEALKRRADQSDRRGRRRNQRSGPADPGRHGRGGVLRHEHGRAGAGRLATCPTNCRSARASPRDWARAPIPQSAARRRWKRPSTAGAAGRRGHGVRHCRAGRRNRRRRGPGGGIGGQAAGRADDRGGHQAVLVRRRAAHAAGRAEPGRAGRHASTR